MLPKESTKISIATAIRLASFGLVQTSNCRPLSRHAAGPLGTTEGPFEKSSVDTWPLKSMGCQQPNCGLDHWGSQLEVWLFKMQHVFQQNQERCHNCLQRTNCHSKPLLFWAGRTSQVYKPLSFPALAQLVHASLELPWAAKSWATWARKKALVMS